MSHDAYRARDQIALCQDGAGADRLFALGISYSSSVRADLVAAHVCFNLAASKGHRQASDRRLEIAAEMSASEIAAAQRAARHWLATG